MVISSEWKISVVLIVMIRKAYVIIAINNVVHSEENVIFQTGIWGLYPIVIVYIYFSYYYLLILF